MKNLTRINLFNLTCNLQSKCRSTYRKENRKFKQDILQMLKTLHYSNNNNQGDMKGKNFDRQ